MMNQDTIGFSCLNLDDDPEHGSLLDNPHILQKFQNSGIGKQLIQNYAAKVLQKAKTAKMYLWVYEVNENARKVYEHLGAFHLYTIKKSIEDGSKARVCKYLWEDVSSLL